MKRVVIVILVLFGLPTFGVAAGSANAPTQDSVVGSGFAGTGTFDISAVSGPLGESASGQIRFDIALGTIVGPVTHLCVSGNEAVLAGEVSAESTFGVGFGFAVHVEDNSRTGGFDLLRLQLEGFVFSSCPDFQMLNPAAVESGDIVVTDACLKDEKAKKCKE